MGASVSANKVAAAFKAANGKTTYVSVEASTARTSRFGTLHIWTASAPTLGGLASRLLLRFPAG